MTAVREAVRRAQREVYARPWTPGEHLLDEPSNHRRDVEVDGVDLAIEMPVHRPYVANSRGSLQGGLIATLIDVVAGRVAAAGLDAGHSSATSDMNVHFLAPIVEGPARAEGTVLRRGRRSVVVHVDVRDLASDRLAAVSTIAFTVLAPLAD